MLLAESTRLLSTRLSSSPTTRSALKMSIEGFRIDYTLLVFSAFLQGLNAFIHGSVYYD